VGQFIVQIVGLRTYLMCFKI